MTKSKIKEETVTQLRWYKHMTIIKNYDGSLAELFK